MLDLQNGQVYQVNDPDFGVALIEVIAVSLNHTFFNCHWLSDNSHYHWTIDNGVLVNYLVENAAITRYIGLSKSSHKLVHSSIRGIHSFHGDNQVLFGTWSRSKAESEYKLRNTWERGSNNRDFYHDEYYAHITDWSVDSVNKAGYGETTIVNL